MTEKIIDLQKYKQKKRFDNYRTSEGKFSIMNWLQDPETIEELDLELSDYKKD